MRWTQMGKQCRWKRQCRRAGRLSRWQSVFSRREECTGSLRVLCRKMYPWAWLGWLHSGKDGHERMRKAVFSSHSKKYIKIDFCSFRWELFPSTPFLKLSYFSRLLRIIFFKLIKIAFRCLRGRQRNHQTLEKSQLVFFLFQLQKVNWKSPSIEYSLSTSRPSARIWNWISLYLINKFSKGLRSFW